MYWPFDPLRWPDDSKQQFTLPENNSEFTPENGWLEDEFPFGNPYFQVLC